MKPRTFTMKQAALIALGTLAALLVAASPARAQGEGRRSPVRMGPTTVTVIDENESVDDVITRVREARLREQGRNAEDRAREARHASGAQDKGEKDQGREPGQQTERGAKDSGNTASGQDRANDGKPAGGKLRRLLGPGQNIKKDGEVKDARLRETPRLERLRERVRERLRERRERNGGGDRELGTQPVRRLER